MKLPKQKINLLKDLKLMMYGFGDTVHPRDDSAKAIENYLLFYLKKILNDTKCIGVLKGKVKTDDLLFVIKKDKRKLKRVKDLLRTNEKLLEARKTFDFEEFEKND